MSRNIICARTTVILCLATLVMACTQGEGNGYCDNHHLIHDSHAATTGSLTIIVGRENVLEGTVSLPAGTIADEGQQSLISRLEEPGRIMTVSDGGRCEGPSLSELEAVGSQSVAFNLSCDSMVPMRQIDVTLLATIPEIDEFVVSVQTTATSKHFAISRQCPSPLFRVNGESN